MKPATQYPQAEKYKADTHLVENIPPVLENLNLYTHDPLLTDCVERGGANWAHHDLTKLGSFWGNAETIRWGEEANRVKPILNSHDQYGHRIDQVDFHPHYHQLMKASIAQGLVAEPWLQQKIGAHVKRAVGRYINVQTEAGHGCPVTMSFAAVPTLQKCPTIAKQWLAKLFNRNYDGRNIPDSQKQNVTIGMAMTEKQGGSDVRTNTTLAYPIERAGNGALYELVGHKYFVSAPMSDAFLMLAQAKGGISCFLVPRWRPDGSKNPMQIIRLKDKMGNASNASCETELRGALGWLIGEEGRGIANILEMVALTRFDCLVASAGEMRAHMTQVFHHTAHRQAFGNYLNQQPLMRNLLTDLEIETQAATLMAFRSAQALDQIAAGNQEESLLMRIATPIGKYWVCKRQVSHAFEAMEIIGGSAVMENSVMPRHYREAPINSIWEGSGNVQCLDVLRVMQKEPLALQALLTEISLAKGSDQRFDHYYNQLQKSLADKKEMEYRARSLVEKMAISLQASLLLRYGSAECAEAFCAGRLQNNSGNTYGMLPTEIECQAIILT